MTPQDLVPYTGQIVELRLVDGERVRAHIVSVDPDVLENHLFYLLLEVLEPGPPRTRPVRVGDGLACSAKDIAALVPTDGKKHRPRVQKSRWRFW